MAYYQRGGAESSSQLWRVLYAANTTKKSKRWIDGFLKAPVLPNNGGGGGALSSPSGRVVLTDLESKTVESCWLKPGDPTIEPGAELTLEHYLVQVEELASTEGRTVDAPIPDSRSPFASQEDAPSSFVSSGLSFVSSISSSQLSATPPVSEHARPAAPPPPPRPFGLSRSQPSHWKPPAASASVPTTIAAAAAQATPRVSSYPVPYGVGARSMLVPAPSALPSQQSGHSSSGRSTHELLAFLGGGASSETPSGTPSAAPAVVSSIARAEPAPLFHQRSLPAPVTSLYAPSPPPSASTFASTSAFSTALPVARPTAAALARLPPRPTGECMQPRVAEPVAHHAVKPANPNPSDFDDLDDLDDIGDLLSAIDGSEPAALTVAPAATQPFAGQPRPLQRPPPAPASSSAVSFRQYQVPSSGRPAPRPPLASEHGPSSSASPLGSSPSQAPFSPSQAPHSASPIAIVSRAAGTDADPGFLANLPEQHPIPLAIAAADECIAEETPKRSARINADFPTLRSYRQTMFSALNETINLQVREKLRLFHLGMKQATLSFLASRPAAPGAHGSRSQDANAVKCRCGKPAVLLMCKKEGANKGRFFHKCGDCQFFAWASSVAKPNTLIASALEQDGTGGTVTIGTPRMLEEYHKAREVALYYNCSLTDSRDGAGSGSSAGASWRGKGRGGGRGGWRGRGRARESAWREYTVNPDESSFSSASRSRGIAVTNSATLFVELSHKSRTTYGRDDLWLVTSRLDFEPSVTVLAKSTFFGPASNLVIELEIIHGSGQSLRQDAVDLGGANVHCIHLGSFSSELTALSCQVTYESIPVLPYLLSEPPLLDEVGVGRNALRRPGPGRGDASSDFGTDQRRMASKSDESRYLFSIGMLYADPAMLSLLLRDFETKYPLNPDQRTVLRACARMFLHPDTSPADLADLDEPDTLDWSQAPSVTLEGGSHSPVLLVHGVFGAGKSFILSVLVVFLASLFEMLQGPVAPGSRQWKVLISSTTNVAVDRIMHGLLGLGYSDFVRVGSVKKIAKTVLPYSANMSKRSDEQDLTDLEHMLRTEALSPDEIQAVRTTIADIKSGTRPTKLVKSRVVGVTCAAATFPCLDGMSFPFIVLDECSQMTEASSLVPISRFGCKRLILVGDPKQLQPTLEGPEAAHPFGLEQTLFERLALQHKPLVMLRTQYRCHPDISAIPNKLFYDNRLLDGVANAARPPIHPRVPTLCFVNVAGQEVQDGDGSYHNDAEVASIVGILRSLLAGVFPNGVLPGERATPDDASGASAAAKHDLDDVDGDHNVDQRVSSRPAKPCGISVDSIGIITPYKSQAIHIKQALDRLPIRDVHGSSLKSILVATADSFQGGERNIILLSCTRTRQIGFVDSERRTNVALSRAKQHLFIVGGSAMLSRNPLWGEILRFCRARPSGYMESLTFVNMLNDSGVEDHTIMANEWSPGDGAGAAVSASATASTLASVPARGDAADDYDFEEMDQALDADEIAAFEHQLAVHEEDFGASPVPPPPETHPQSTRGHTSEEASNLVDDSAEGAWKTAGAVLERWRSATGSAAVNAGVSKRRATTTKGRRPKPKNAFVDDEASEQSDEDGVGANDEDDNDDDDEDLADFVVPDDSSDAEDDQQVAVKKVSADRQTRKTTKTPPDPIASPQTGRRRPASFAFSLVTQEERDALQQAEADQALEDELDIPITFDSTPRAVPRTRRHIREIYSDNEDGSAGSSDLDDCETIDSQRSKQENGQQFRKRPKRILSSPSSSSSIHDQAI